MSDLSGTVNELVNADSREVIFEKITHLLDAVKIPDLKEIPNLPIHDFRDLNVQESTTILELLKAKTIKELAKVTYNQLITRVDLIREAGVPKEKLELLITAAKYIVKAADYKPIEGLKKIVVAGLDNAGKTALLKSIKKEVAFTELTSLKPTKGATRDDLLLSDQHILLMELGGQKEFRKFYIDQPDRFFLETDIIVYLIDLQDDLRYQESIDYLEQILRTMKYLQESPDWIILFHKCDPDIVKLSIFQEKLDFMTAKIKKAFKPYKLNFEIQTSSIYNIVSMTPSFSRMLKGLFSGVAMEDEEKIQSIGTLLMKVVDSFLGMETNVNRQINYMKTRLDKIETHLSKASASGGAAAPAFEKTSTSAPKPPKPKPSGPRGGLSPRAALLSELKQVFGLRGKIE
ncbi:MAG: 50S ribosome-binding GTPase [Candidatus Helarchaeota archaeon]|nr:50S ribosome-binding GTPase [Candidatus Helarchaeota archaeon]